MRSRKTPIILNFLAVFFVFVLGSAGTAFAYAPSWPSNSSTNALQRVSDSLPPLPRGRRTVLGGQIYNVNPVNDQFKLRIPGGQKVTIYYDERTRLYEDGATQSVLDLHPASHASIETTLDGSKIFAVSVHLLSRAPEGEVHGQVLGYSPSTETLKLRSNLSSDAILLKVPPQVTIVATGQVKSDATLNNLVPGTLANVSFQPGNGGKGIVTRIDLLAYPGAQVVFQGKVIFINMQSGRLTIDDVADDQNYQISFTPQQLIDANSLHEGANVKVVAEFDGSRYIAQSISPL